MKKLILTAIGLVAGAALIHAQGDITFVDLAAHASTTTVAYTNGLIAANSGTLTETAASSTGTLYYYVLLASTSTSAADAGNPAGADWAALSPVSIYEGGIAYGQNGPSAGGTTGPGGSTGFQSSLAAGTTYDMMVVGWSASLGTTWSAVSADFADNFAGYTGPTGYAGYSNIGTIDPTAAPASGATIFGGTGVGQGDMILYTVTAVPEPATLALAGLGGLSMLFLRRRKS